jgi:hypothetical protein
MSSVESNLTVAISSPLTFSKVLQHTGKSFAYGDLVMRTIAALAVLSALLALGGCFHHSQVYTEPVVLPPLKLGPLVAMPMSHATER